MRNYLFRALSYFIYGNEYMYMDIRVFFGVFFKIIYVGLYFLNIFEVMALFVLYIYRIMGGP